LQIARKYLVPKSGEKNGLKPENVSFTDPALLAIVRHYTREAGVRNLERSIMNICRKVAVDIVKKGQDASVVVTEKDLDRYLGIRRFDFGKQEAENQVGTVTGLAWTEVGGELLVIEVSVVTGRGRLIITGKLGDVMQESAQAAMMYVRSRASFFGLPKDFYSKVDIHVHVPEGAVPKDGPSAGIAIMTAITSALTGIPVDRNTAMTGEITLRGRVFQIGGLKEKILAAHRGGISRVIVPKQNEQDIEEIPISVRKGIEIITVDNADEVLREALCVEDHPQYVSLLAERKLRYEELYGKPGDGKAPAKEMDEGDNGADEAKQVQIIAH
ncbi:MAG TPA: magnesium chelatase domain-containing protein, partial [Oligoflexia bacterium]|nr:magnesium chelatase domain-containing protein [Oligoflexia bacterium]